ncbi:MAG TPA: hypothetical protein VGO11_23985 [Chthoniobacteraceae bacterium]|nr:hypothetical protein [Chthoniobacteraceae bacterium]
MLRTNSLRAVFSLPVAFAVALLGYSGFAFADVASQTTALNLKLQDYARQEGKLTATSTAAQIAAVNVQTAVADDLVFAVYELAQAAGDNPQNIADIATAALTAIPAATPAAAKVRADKDKIVGRIMETAVVASSTSGPNSTLPPDEATIVDKLVQQLGAVNSTLPAAKQLTAAGKQLLVAKALRSTNGLGAAIEARAEAFIPTGATNAAKDTARTAFNVAVLKLLAFKPITNDPAKLATTNTFFPILNGVQEAVKGEPAFVEGTPPSIFGVREYIHAALDGYTSTTNKAAAATNIAAGVAATVPGAAGAVIAGYLKDLYPIATPVGDLDIINFLKNGRAAVPANGATPAQAAVLAPVTNAKLAAAVSDIVADSFKLLSAQPADLQVTNFATGLTAAVKGKVASGLIRANPGNATALVNDVLAADVGVAGKGVVSTGIAAFAQAAAQGNSTAAAAITTASIAKIPFVPPAGATPTAAAIAAAMKADNTKIQAVAIGVGKSVALVDPNKAADVAEALFGVTRNGGNPYSIAGDAGEQARQTLAHDLAVGLATNYAATGAAVAGVAHQSLVKNPKTGTAALDQIAAIAGIAIKAAPKATVDIALRVASNADIKSLTSTTTTTQLATALVNNFNVASANAGAVAAGLSLSDTAHTDLITTAVINSGVTNLAARQAAALTIANTVAINVDVEAIGLVAQSVGALLQPAKNLDGTTNTSKLPKLTSIGTLATSLGKAINTKPLVTWANRVDELSELAAELTKQYLAHAGDANSGVPDGTDADATKAAAEVKALATGLASIGTSIFKSASAKLLANTFHNPADVADLAENVSGAIAQVLANSSKLAGTAKDSLLTNTATGSLIKLLTTAATASKSTAQVTAAFANVFGTKTGGVYGNYVSPISGTNVTRADSSVGRYETGVYYEIGGVNPPETPVKNL